MADLGHKILIIDDDLFLLDMYALKFQEAGFDVATAKSAEEALEGLIEKKFQPEIILLDILMPTMDGFQFLKDVKEKKILTGAKPKIIVLSNLGQKEEIEQGMKLGARDYIIKANHTPSEVVERVKEILGI